ncbi:MAG: hypothetical protein AB1330_11775 [Bacillota bacterium]
MPEEKDLFDLFEEWGYEAHAFDLKTLKSLTPAERRSLLDQIEEIDPDAAEELMKCLPQS